MCNGCNSCCRSRKNRCGFLQKKALFFRASSLSNNNYPWARPAAARAGVVLCHIVCALFFVHTPTKIVKFHGFCAVCGETHGSFHMGSREVRARKVYVCCVDFTRTHQDKLLKLFPQAKVFAPCSGSVYQHPCCSAIFLCFCDIGRGILIRQSDCWQSLLGYPIISRLGGWFSIQPTTSFLRISVGGFLNLTSRHFHTFYFNFENHAFVFSSPLP